MMSCVYKREETIDEGLVCLRSSSLFILFFCFSQRFLFSLFSDLMRSRNTEEILLFSLFFTLASFLFSLFSLSLLPCFLLSLFLSSSFSPIVYTSHVSFFRRLLYFSFSGASAYRSTSRRKGREKERKNVFSSSFQEELVVNLAGLSSQQTYIHSGDRVSCVYRQDNKSWGVYTPERKKTSILSALPHRCFMNLFVL